MSSDSNFPRADSADVSETESCGRSWKRRATTCLKFLGFALVIGFVVFQVWVRTGPVPPALHIDGLDPAVALVLQDCHDAVRRRPRSGDAWGKLGMAFLVYEFNDEALMCFENAERFGSADPTWPYFRGVSLFPASTEAALNSLRRAVELDRDKDSAARLRLANILSELGQYNEAEKHYRAVIDKWPDNTGAILGIGRLAYAAGDAVGSLPYLHRAANSPYTASAALKLLVAVHNRLGDSNLAAQFQTKLAQLPGDQPLPDRYVDEASKLRVGLRAWVDFAAEQVRQGNVKQAKPLAKKVVAQYPKSAEAWMLMAKIGLAEKDYEGALSAAETAVKLSPEAVEPHVQLGVTQLFRQQVDDAIISFQQAIHLKPELSEAHHNLGLCYAIKSDWSTAIRSFGEAIRLNPGFTDSYVGLADSLGQQGDKIGAIAAIQQALRLRPDDPKAYGIVDKYNLKKELGDSGVKPD